MLAMRVRRCLFGGKSHSFSTGANVHPHALGGPVLFDPWSFVGLQEMAPKQGNPCREKISF